MTALPRRGQPLIALAGLLALWIGARAWGPVASLLEVPCHCRPRFRAGWSPKSRHPNPSRSRRELRRCLRLQKRPASSRKRGMGLPLHHGLLGWRRQSRQPRNRQPLLPAPSRRCLLRNVSRPRHLLRHRFPLAPFQPKSAHRAAGPRMAGLSGVTRHGAAPRWSVAGHMGPARQGQFCAIVSVLTAGSTRVPICV